MRCQQLKWITVQYQSGHSRESEREYSTVCTRACSRDADGFKLAFLFSHQWRGAFSPYLLGSGRAARRCSWKMNCRRILQTRLPYLALNTTRIFSRARRFPAHHARTHAPRRVHKYIGTQASRLFVHTLLPPEGQLPMLTACLRCQWMGSRPNPLPLSISPLHYQQGK